MPELPEALRELIQDQVLAAQDDGVHLGIKFSAQTLRGIADGCAEDPNIAPDYIRGLRDAAVLVEQFGENIKKSKGQS